MRLYDKIYLKSNLYKKPKESVKFLQKILNKRLSSKKNYKVIDIGCANGELLYFLKKYNKNFNLTGVDIKQNLLNKAKNNLPQDITLKKMDFNTKIKSFEKFDIIICSGVIGIFDDLKVFFSNINKIKKKNSKFYFFGAYNDYPYDIKTKYVDLNMKKKVLQSGWNIWSIKTLKKHFGRKKFKKHYFNMSFDFKKNQNDLIRSWTIKIGNKRYFTNGLMLLLNQKWLEVF
jgi:2-polyprenyl-3-methyl-5-hydroxy-6-metoxy-1,4-benzoquinol methylase